MQKYYLQHYVIYFLFFYHHRSLFLCLLIFSSNITPPSTVHTSSAKKLYQTSHPLQQCIPPQQRNSIKHHTPFNSAYLLSKETLSNITPPSTVHTSSAKKLYQTSHPLQQCIPPQQRNSIKHHTPFNSAYLLSKETLSNITPPSTVHTSSAKKLYQTSHPLQQCIPPQQRNSIKHHTPFNSAYLLSKETLSNITPPSTAHTSSAKKLYQTSHPLQQRIPPQQRNSIKHHTPFNSA